MKGVSSNPALRSFSTCYGVVNLKLLCDPPPPSGYPASGWVGPRVGGWVSQNLGRANIPPPPPPQGNVSAPGARRASFVTRAPLVDCCR